MGGRFAAVAAVSAFMQPVEVREAGEQVCREDVLPCSLFRIWPKNKKTAEQAGRFF
jgi:hypothetical protein